MKLIKCVVREEKIDETTDALKMLALSGLTVSRVPGRGNCEQQTEFYRGIAYYPRLLPKMMIDASRRTIWWMTWCAS